MRYNQRLDGGRTRWDDDGEAAKAFDNANFASSTRSRGPGFETRSGWTWVRVVGCVMKRNRLGRDNLFRPQEADGGRCTMPARRLGGRLRLRGKGCGG